jgi:hypothetical protein
LAVRIVELIQVTPARHRGHQPPQPSQPGPDQQSLSGPPSDWDEFAAQFRVRDRSNDR